MEIFLNDNFAQNFGSNDRINFPQHFTKTDFSEERQDDLCITSQRINNKNGDFVFTACL